MLASPGVDLRRDGDSSVTHVSSLGFVNADGVPFKFKNANTFVAPTKIGFLFCFVCFYFRLASGPGWRRKPRSKKRRTGYSTR
jgi:hypothetical protein